jgi:Flp pilus assembly protein TadD
MLAYLGGEGRDEIVTTSLLRLLRACEDGAKWPIVRRLASDRSPLVRAAAVAALEDDTGGRDRLLAATRDDVRLVRVRAAAALGGLDLQALAGPERAGLEGALAELERSLLARPDDFTSHYNLGNLHLERGDPAAAAERYRRAVALRPDHVASLVNLSMAEARRGRLAAAEEPLRQAIEVDPRSIAAHFNLGLLLAERGRRGEAAEALRRTLELDPRNAPAAYNLAVIVGQESPGEAAALARQAAESAPRERRYAWTHAFYLERSGDAAGAARVLERLLVRHPGYPDAWALLGAVLESQGRAEEAREVYRRASGTAELSLAARRGFEARAHAPSPR